MNLNITHIIVLVLASLIAQPCGGQVPEKQVRKEAGKILDTDIILERKHTALADLIENQGTLSTENVIPVKPSDEMFVMYAVGGNDPIGYCFASSAAGRFENFEYFILYDTACVVQKVNVWKYRSSHGGAVAGQRWLRQFAGYSKGALTYGKDVQAISGATISGESLVREVARAGNVIREVFKGDSTPQQ